MWWFYMFVLGVRQGKALSHFLVSMYLNDIEDYLLLNWYDGVNLSMMKLYLLLYAADIIIMSDTEDGLYKGCDAWTLTVNTSKTEVI